MRCHAWRSGQNWQRRGMCDRGLALVCAVHYRRRMKLLSSLLLITATLTATACKKDDQDAPNSGAGPAAKGNEAAPVSDELAAVLPKQAPPAFAAWDLPARAKAWQGAWVTEASLGSPIAYEIKGAVATSWDGKAEKQLSFELESPCSAKLTEHTASGSSGTTSHFTLRNGALATGLGDAGSRKGKTAVACISNEVLTLDEAGTCLSWSSMFDRWKSEPSTCGFAQKDGKEVFTAKIHGMDTTLIVEGDALLSEQLSKVSAAHHADFAAAKAATKR